jgi:hypothetical protein
MATGTKSRVHMGGPGRVPNHVGVGMESQLLSEATYILIPTQIPVFAQFPLAFLFLTWVGDPIRAGSVRTSCYTATKRIV